MKNYYETLTNQYAVSKTLKNKLIPIGSTLEHIKEKQIIESDKVRAADYKVVKGILDRYHMQVMEDTLSKLRLDNLDEVASLYRIKNKSDNEKASLVKYMENLRKQVSDCLKSHESYRILDKKEMFSDVLPYFVEPEEKDLVSSFNKFTTYFKGYNTIRAELYSSEEKSSTVAYRLINENMPKFFDNMLSFNKIKAAGLALENYDSSELDGAFMPTSYSDFVTQEQIDKYNAAIGSINSTVNLYNQKTKEKLPKLKILFKLPLYERSEQFITEFLDDQEVIDNLESFSNNFLAFVSSEDINYFFQNILESEGKGIYVKNDVALTTYSKDTLGAWNAIANMLSLKYDNAYSGKKKGEAYETEKGKILKKIESLEIIDINELSNTNTLDRYVSLLKTEIEQIRTYNFELKEAIRSHDTTRKLSKNDGAVGSIKKYLDAVKQFERDLKLIQGNGLESEKNDLVYSSFELCLDEFYSVDAIYNMTRNYLTKKAFSTEKFKLNFNSPTLLDGWDKNKEESNLGILFMKDEHFYLGIMDSKSNKEFRNIPKANSSSIYKKVDYKLLPGANKMLPKVFFAKSNIDYYAPSDEIERIYTKGSFKKGDQFKVGDCHKLIDFFKQSIEKHPDWKNFDFAFSETSTYEDISGFYREVEQQGYKITYTDVDESYINELIDAGKLYFFEIYNKDFSKYSHGNLNLHTVYFKALFNPENLKNVVYKLNGEAEIFYRPASISEEDIITHVANVPIKNKNKDNPKDTSEFDYDIIKDKRYTKDQFELHFPITINFGSGSVSSAEFNARINSVLKKNNDVNVIGIDRGERNLLYVVVVNRKGELLEQISLNEIINGSYKVNYHEILTNKEKARMDARLNWSEIENIKDLKEGYISQVVNVLVQFVIKYNAIICMEDLNLRFMQKRGKVERSVYQKFEKMLIDKLNLIVLNKDKKQEHISEIGGALHPIQLTAPSTTIKNTSLQTGAIFYVPAYLTSKIDPTTGFVNLLYPKYENKDMAQDFIKRFDFIEYDGTDFVFKYNEGSFGNKGIGKDWCLTSKGTRIQSYRNSEKNNNFDYKIVEPTVLIKELLYDNNVAYKAGTNLIDDICKVEDAGFYKNFLFYLKLILQMRNSNPNTDEDYIISPVKNSSGVCFDSRIMEDKYPKDADANGAYNIARKGIMILNSLDSSEDLLKFKQSISNNEWLLFASENTL